MDPYLSIKDYMATKSFKFSDAYSVTVLDTELNRRVNNPTNDKTAENLTDLFSTADIQDNGIETFQNGLYLMRRFHFKNCRSFTAPQYKPKEKSIKYCNTTRVVYMPNIESCEPFKIVFNETDRQYAMKFIKYCLRKSFYDEKEDHFNDSYRPYRYIDQIKVDIWNNNLTKIVMSHIFSSCRISDYDYDYALDYSQARIINPSISFTYLKYEIDTSPDMNDDGEWLSKLNKSRMSGYVPGGYHPNAGSDVLRKWR